ncbi:MAG TPA: hypothetical protein VM009_02130 [Terriglobales bacterium]|nr:hypothetical protein [Terriglobales bacterium]
MRFVLIICFLATTVSSAVCQAKGNSPQTTPPANAAQSVAKPAKKLTAPKLTGSKLTKEQQFILQTVQSAVALSQPDPQDRLRVLSSAAQVTSTISGKYAAQLAKEGVQLEASMVANGQTPAVSIMASGYADCPSMKAFADQLDPKFLMSAEQSLIGAITKCPKATLEIVRQRTDAALEQGIIAPRLLMALMERTGAESPWTQERFIRLFSGLPDASRETSAQAAPDYAAMYASFAGKVGKDVARSTGVKMLTWLNKLEATPLRSMAINITASGLEQALGKEKYQELLSADVIVRQVVESKGPPGEIEPAAEESASVLQAMGGSGTEQQADLRQLPASLRAREAAAHGFARGIAKDRDSASSFFDMAFSAADEAWGKRADIKDAAGIIEEVCEAAAQVDALDALRRAQHLEDLTAQAIGMIAVARVVAGRDAQ